MFIRSFAERGNTSAQLALLVDRVTKTLMTGHKLELCPRDVSVISERGSCPSNRLAVDDERQHS